MPIPDFEPQQGSPETLVNRLRSFLEPFDTGCVEAWSGAGETEIAEYIRWCELKPGKVLPASYLTYLRALGVNDGDLLGDFKYTTILREIIGLYEDTAESEFDALSPDYPVCGLHYIADQISIDLTSQGEPPIAVTADGYRVRELSKSWEALVMQAAVLRAEARRRPLIRWASRSRERIALTFGAEGALDKMHAEIDNFARTFGLYLSWVSDSQHQVLVGERGCLFTDASGRGGALMHFFGSDQQFIDEVQRRLEPALGAGKSGRSGLVEGRLTAV